MNIDTLQRAWKLASDKHNGQKYGGPKEGEQVEYIEHIGAVLLEVKNAISRDKTIDDNKASLGAIFHDILEDTDCDPELIRLSYGQDVLEIVMALTKNETLASKKEMMLDSLSRIKNTHKEAAIIKMADRISNLYSPPFYWPKAKMIEYVAEARMIHDELSVYSAYLGERLMTKIEKYEIEHIKNHSRNYTFWKFSFTGDFIIDDVELLIKTLSARYGDRNVQYKLRVIGEQITLSTIDCKIFIEGNEVGNNEYIVAFERDGFLENSDRIAFLNDLKKVLNECAKDVCLEYFFDSKLEITSDFLL